MYTTRGEGTIAMVEVVLSEVNKETVVIFGARNYIRMNLLASD